MNIVNGNENGLVGLGSLTKLDRSPQAIEKIRKEYEGLIGQERQEKEEEVNKRNQLRYRLSDKCAKKRRLTPHSLLLPGVFSRVAARIAPISPP